MKLWVLGLVSALMLSACSSGSITNGGSGTIESACEAVRESFLWLNSDATSNPNKMTEAYGWLDEAIPVFRELSGNNPKYVEYLEILGQIKTRNEFSWSDNYDARSLRAFCSVP
jgi:hypothetical protein